MGLGVLPVGIFSLDLQLVAKALGHRPECPSAGVGCGAHPVYLWGGFRNVQTGSRRPHGPLRAPLAEEQSLLTATGQNCRCYKACALGSGGGSEPSFLNLKTMLRSRKKTSLFSGDTHKLLPVAQKDGDVYRPPRLSPTSEPPGRAFWVPLPLPLPGCSNPVRTAGLECHRDPGPTPTPRPQFPGVQHRSGSPTWDCGDPQ